MNMQARGFCMRQFACHLVENSKMCWKTKRRCGACPARRGGGALASSSIVGRAGAERDCAGGGGAGTGAAPTGSSAPDDGRSYDASTSASASVWRGLPALQESAAARLPLPRSLAAARQAGGDTVQAGAERAPARRRQAPAHQTMADSMMPSQAPDAKELT